MTKMNTDLPVLVTELRAMSQNLNDLTEQARGGVEHAACVVNAVGEVGESVNQVHSLVRGSGGTCWPMWRAWWRACAAKQVVTERLKEGGHHNGG